MAKKPLLSIPEIAERTGYTRQQMCTWHKQGKIPFELAKWGGKQVRYHNSPELRAWMKKIAEQKANPLPTMTRAQRISQRRAEKIERLDEILNNETEVSALDKELALWYYRCLFRLWYARMGLSFREWPLLEGIHALYDSKSIFGHGLKIDHGGIEETIERLPTRPETTPQNGQSSLNASD